MGSRKPTSTARFFSTRCSASNSPACARLSPSSAPHRPPDARRRVRRADLPTRRRRRAGCRRRIEGPDKEIRRSPARGRRAILNKLVEAEGFEQLLRPRNSPAPSASASTGGDKSCDSRARTDHQARRRARRQRDRHRHGASRPAQCARAGDEQAARAPSSTSSQAGFVLAGRSEGVRRREISPWPCPPTASPAMAAVRASLANP